MKPFASTLIGKRRCQPVLNITIIDADDEEDFIPRFNSDLIPIVTLLNLRGYVGLNKHNNSKVALIAIGCICNAHCRW